MAFRGNQNRGYFANEKILLLLLKFSCCCCSRYKQVKFTCKSNHSLASSSLVIFIENRNSFKIREQKFAEAKRIESINIWTKYDLHKNCNHPTESLLLQFRSNRANRWFNDVFVVLVSIQVVVVVVVAQTMTFNDDYVTMNAIASLIRPANSRTTTGCCRPMRLTATSLANSERLYGSQRAH